jgi:hypothetical protein
MTIPNVNQEERDSKLLGGDVSEDASDPINENAWSIQSEKCSPQYPNEKYALKYDVKN